MTSEETQPKANAWSDLTRRYVEDLPRQLDTIRLCLQRSDFANVEQHAHRAKGTAATYRLEKIAAQFLALEEAARHQQAPRVQDILLQLTDLVTQTLAALATSEGKSHG